MGAWTGFIMFSFCLRSISIMNSSFSTDAMICFDDLSNNSFDIYRYFSSERHSRRYLFLQYNFWYLSPTIWSTDSLLSCTILSISSATLFIFYFRYLSISAIMSSYIVLMSLTFMLSSFLANYSIVFHFETASLSTLMFKAFIYPLKSSYNFFA